MPVVLLWAVGVAFIWRCVVRWIDRGLADESARDAAFWRDAE